MSEAVMREELHKSAGDLMALRRRLMEIAQSPPATLTDLRSFIEGIVKNSLTRAIDDLLEAARA